VDRGLNSRVASGIGRFFRRAKNFLHELVFAGIMALTGPTPLTDEESEAADNMAKVQADYFDRFEREVRLNPPIELAEPPLISPDVTLIPIWPKPLDVRPMAAKEFAARAAQYGNSPWGSVQDIVRAGNIRKGIVRKERRIHVGKDRPCDGCAKQETLGWQEPGVLLPIGACECISSCHCHFEYMGPDGKARLVSDRPKNLLG
jgi:hypothetical protein